MRPVTWCAALTIGSLSEDPVNGITLNPACQGEIRGGIEYVSFVFLTRSGTPTGPPNPLQFNSATPGGGPASRRLAGLGLAGGAVYDAVPAAAAAGHGLPLATRDRRAAQTYRALDADLEILPHRQDQDS